MKRFFPNLAERVESLTFEELVIYIIAPLFIFVLIGFYTGAL